jgi:hypothetical protein
MSKIVTLAIAAGAYVLGARAGRERYEQIKVNAQRIWSDPRVQDKTQQATDVVKERAPQVKDKVSGAVKQTADKVSSRNGSDQPTTTTSGTAAAK